MRRPVFRLLTLLLAWCVGFQTTASAVGLRCAQASESATSEVVSPMTHEQHHHAGMDGAGMSMHHHEHHHPGSMVLASAHDHGSHHGCTCGYGCAMPGCASAGSVIASAQSLGFASAAPAAFSLKEPLTSLRDAHGLDLIRPPSKS